MSRAEADWIRQKFPAHSAIMCRPLSDPIHCAGCPMPAQRFSSSLKRSIRRTRRMPTESCPCRLCGSEHADHMQHLVHHCTAAAAVSARQEFADVVPLCALPQALTMASARSPDRLHRVATLC